MGYMYPSDTFTIDTDANRKNPTLIAKILRIKIAFQLLDPAPKGWQYFKNITIRKNIKDLCRSWQLLFLIPPFVIYFSSLKTHYHLTDFK